MDPLRPKVVKEVGDVVIVETDDGFDVLHAITYTRWGALGWKMIGIVIKDKRLMNNFTADQGLTFPEAEELADKVKQWHDFYRSGKKKGRVNEQKAAEAQAIINERKSLTDEEQAALGEE